MISRLVTYMNRLLRWRRWTAFYSVGALGFLVQLGALYVLAQGVNLHYLLATGIAVEVAIMHNFLWHECWTWAERARRHKSGLPGRIARFHLANGVISIAGNLVFMRIFVGVLMMNCLTANVIAVLLSSILNFLAGDRFVFRRVAEPS